MSGESLSGETVLIMMEDEDRSKVLRTFREATSYEREADVMGLIRIPRERYEEWQRVSEAADRLQCELRGLDRY